MRPPHADAAAITRHSRVLSPVRGTFVIQCIKAKKDPVHPLLRAYHLLLAHHAFSRPYILVHSSPLGPVAPPCRPCRRVLQDVEGEPAHHLVDGPHHS